MINQKIESSCLKPGGELNISLPVAHNAIFLWVVRLSWPHCWPHRPGHNNTSMGYLMVIKLNLMTLSEVKVAILTQILRAPAQFDLHFICLERERECVIKGA